MNLLLTLIALVLVTALSVSETVKDNRVTSLQGFSEYQSRVNAIRNNQ